MKKPSLSKHVLRFDELDSTNTHAKQILKDQDVPEGTIIQCHHQTAGRGYASNTWESSPGKNITASWVLRPHFLRPDEQFMLTQAFSLAIKETILSYYSGNVSIKWPNDIYADDQKLAGILVENSIMGDTIKDCIAGIGLNVNQDVFNSDAPNPVSLKQLCHKDFNLDEVLQKLHENIEKHYFSLDTAQREETQRKYHKSLYRLEQRSRFRAEGREFEGTIKGTDMYGRLQMQLDDGTLALFDFKEVEFLI